jgi:hypothetical protein
MGKNGKGVPHSAVARRDRKDARSAPVDVQKNPTWRFSAVDRGGPFPWPVNHADELEILQKLRQFDGMNWSEIEGADHHAIDVSRLSRAAQRRLEEIKQDDVSEVFSFHFSGKRRIIGIRIQGVVRLLWWDPDHKVCPSKKKRT